MFRITDGTVRMIALFCFTGWLLGWLTERNVDWSILGSWVERLAFVFVLIVGLLIARLVSRDTSSTLTGFNRDDAKVDRYRYETVGKLNSGIGAQMRADATLRVIDGKRIDQIAQSRAEQIAASQQRGQWLLPDNAGDDDDEMGVHYVD